MQVFDDGRVELVPVKRRVTYTDAPLTATLDALLHGPTAGELSAGIRSLIPPETRLLGVRVENGTAYINISESFRFNPLGQEGLVLQLKQIIYTATEFPTVEQVQILIEGKTVRYLGSEGIPIDHPLSRSSL